MPSMTGPALAAAAVLIAAAIVSIINDRPEPVAPPQAPVTSVSTTITSYPVRLKST